MSEITQNRLHAVHGEARFTAGDEINDNYGATPPGGSIPPSSRTQFKARPERPIPTDRLRFDNQVQVLKTVASLSGNNRRGVDAETMSAAIELKGGTGGLNSRFFRSVNWFESVGRGEYTASPGLLLYSRHINIDPDGHYEATEGMRGEMRRSWVWEVVGPMLESGNPIREKALLLPLAQAAGAQNHTAQLETIIEWLVWVGLALRDGEFVKLAETEQSTSVAIPDDGSSEPTGPTELNCPIRTESVEIAPPGTDEGRRGPVNAGSDAIISFNISVRLTAHDVQNLSDDQMQFVMGLAEKLRA